MSSHIFESVMKTKKEGKSPGAPGSTHCHCCHMVSKAVDQGAERHRVFVREENRMRGNGLFSTASSLAVGNRLPSVVLCFLLSCRWQPGPTVRCVLVLAIPNFGCQSWSCLLDSGLFLSAFNALGMMNRDSAHCTLRWLSLQCFNLQRLSGLNLIEEDCKILNCLSLYSFLADYVCPETIYGRTQLKGTYTLS